MAARKRVINRTNKPADPPVVGPDGKVSAAKAATPRMYFNINTQNAIVAYQQSSDKKERETLYVQVIAPAFERLVENLINIYKFTSLHDTFDDLKNDCVSFMFETIHKFDANRGTNAFSYFNVIAKNWLVNRTRQKFVKLKKNISLDTAELELTTEEQKSLDDKWTVISQEETLIQQIDISYIMSILYEIRSKSKNENELLAINGIITVFENLNNIDILNKSAILIYIRELTGLTPKQLSTSMQSIKRNYRFYKNDANFLKLL